MPSYRLKAAVFGAAWGTVYCPLWSANAEGPSTPPSAPATEAAALGASAKGGSATALAPAQLSEQFVGDVERRIADLHRALAIAPDQEPMFRAYAETLRDNGRTIQALFQKRAQATDFSAPARLRWYAQLTATHAEGVGKLVGPFDALYQALSPKQKVAADKFFEELRQRRMAQHGP